jgi:hypothetical protein
MMGRRNSEGAKIKKALPAPRRHPSSCRYATASPSFPFCCISHKCSIEFSLQKIFCPEQKKYF